MIVFAENSLPETSKDKIYYGYYQFFLNLYGLFLDRIKNKPKEISNLKPRDLNDENVCRAIDAINSIEQEDISFGLYYSDIELISVFRIKEIEDILHIPEIVFLKKIDLEERIEILRQIIERMLRYAEEHNFKKLEFEVSKNDYPLLNILATNGFKAVDEHPKTNSYFPTDILYIDILKRDYERTRSSKQRQI